MSKEATDTWCFVTGATGFIGHYVLADLLGRSMRCMVLLRAPKARSFARLERLLADLNVDAAAMVASGRLRVVEGDVAEDLPTALAAPVSSVIHMAASTRFDADGSGEPMRTNEMGTRHLLAWMQRMSIGKLHLVSSAYQCGRLAEVSPEQITVTPHAFLNAYERTKWVAEQLCKQWSRETGGTLTVYRPSVVVGAFSSGRATKFSGFYVVPRATEILSRGLDTEQRQRVNLRILAQPEDRQNIVPVDYVSRAIAAVVAEPALHGGVYHLTNPQPPTNDAIRLVLERCFGVAGGRFVDPSLMDMNELSEMERLFYAASGPVRSYFEHAPRFERTSAARLWEMTGVTCPVIDDAAMERLIRYASAHRWGMRRAGKGPASSCADYFESFLPLRVPQSRIATMTALSPTIRFVIEDEPEGQWVCRFESGRLAEVHRGTNHLAADFVYTTRRAAFWRAVTGTVPPQQLFLRGDATISGNIEQGLKMAMILHAFTKEFPCTPQTLAEERGRSCKAS